MKKSDMSGVASAGWSLAGGDTGEPGPPTVSGRQLRQLLADDVWLDELIDRAQVGGVSLTGEGGFLPEMIKAVLERGLAAELTGHLGYEAGDPAGRGVPNSRNGHTPKTVQSEIGPLDLAVPRDRDSSFEPRLIPKGQRRLGGLDDMIISLYAGGMTVRDIGHHLQRTLGTELSHDTISKVTDAVLEEVKAWQSRPLDALYPAVAGDPRHRRQTGPRPREGSRPAQGHPPQGPTQAHRGRHRPGLATRPGRPDNRLPRAARRRRAVSPTMATTTTQAALDTVYECPDCGEPTTDRRCPDCNLFTRRLGPGGHCPHCDEIVLLDDLNTTNPARSTTRTYTEDLTGSRR